MQQEKVKQKIDVKWQCIIRRRLWSCPEEGRIGYASTLQSYHVLSAMSKNIYSLILSWRLWTESLQVDAVLLTTFIKCGFAMVFLLKVFQLSSLYRNPNHVYFWAKGIIFIYLFIQSVSQSVNRIVCILKDESIYFVQASDSLLSLQCNGLVLDSDNWRTYCTCAIKLIEILFDVPFGLETRFSLLKALVSSSADGVCLYHLLKE